MALDFACQICMDSGDKIRDDLVDPYAYHILWLRTFQKGQYPFEAEDLTFEEWFDLGETNKLIESIENAGVAFKKTTKGM